MKLIDKLKNIFFEEVEEEDEEELPQTFAKKVEVPKKVNKEPVIRKEVELPKKEDSFMEIKEEKVKEEVVEEKKEEKEFPMMFDESDFLEDMQPIELQEEPKSRMEVYKRESREYNDDKGLYQGKKEMSYVESVNNRSTYSHTKNYYEEKENKGFKPSPIISPIYGILDKNYRKEEVVTKRETRVTNNYKRVDLDTVRNKAFGNDDEIIEKKEIREEKKEEKNNSKIYDVNNNKPQVNRVTLADADEYYNDLGLAYNEDYSDASRNNTRVSKYNPKDKKKNNVDDNLFDLIDSMYSKEE